MIFPTIHLNGTSGESLIEQLGNATGNVELAIDQLNRAAPHGRDYYVQGDHAFAQAEKEHLSRLERLRRVRDELQALLDNVQEQVRARRKGAR